jgi:chromate transporter
MRRGVAVGLLGAFFALLIGLPLLALAFPSDGLTIVNLFYRAGALVFGGGHVVLPLLQHDIVAQGWLTDAQFLSGYGAAQAVPGPLFTLASYIGFDAQTSLQGPLGSLLAVLAIFMPAYLLVAGTLPFWNTLRRQPALQAALIGINAAVVGLLFAALCHPLWTSAVQSIADFGLVALNFALLVYWKRPVWLVVAVSIIGGIGIGFIN